MILEPTLAGNPILGDSDDGEGVDVHVYLDIPV
jgi:hypothetical protein